MFGAIGFFPAICAYYYRLNSRILRTFFVLIVPVWFAIHLVGTFAKEARCFLMPMCVIFFPMIIEIIEFQCKKQDTA